MRDSNTMIDIVGLVTPRSSTRRHVSPHRRAGLTKLRESVVAAPKWQPSLSPFTYEGFCLGGRFVMMYPGGAFTVGKAVEAAAETGASRGDVYIHDCVQAVRTASGTCWSGAQPSSQSACSRALPVRDTIGTGQKSPPLTTDLRRQSNGHRMRTTDACVPGLVEVLEQEWWDCDNALAPIPMNRPSMALGDRNDRRASILEQ